MFLFFYVLIIVIVAVCAGMLLEQHINKEQVSDTVYNCDDFCFEHCKIHEEVYSQYKDPDDAWKELDGGGYCEGCPIRAAMDVLDDEALKKWERKKERNK